MPLQVTARATNRIVLNEHKGSALRGALFDALRKRSCVRLELASCHPCELVPVCPISALVATVDPEWERGADPPRPFAIDPPLEELTQYKAGDQFEFGLTVFGSAARLLPYLVLALGDAGKAGLGRRYLDEGFWTQGRYEVRQVELANPFSGEVECLYDAASDGQRGAPLFRSPANGVEPAHVAAFVERLPTHQERVTLEFLTPTRLVRKGELLARFELPAFLQRLRERLRALERRYGSGEPAADQPEAAEVEVVDNTTCWHEVRGYSRRQRRALPVGGFTGSVTLAGNLQPLLPLLAWGQLTHVGKDATKGNGWYRLRF